MRVGITSFHYIPSYLSANHICDLGHLRGTERRYGTLEHVMWYDRINLFAATFLEAYVGRRYRALLLLLIHPRE